jgi:uncharacterized protein (DUF433 family)
MRDFPLLRERYDFLRAVSSRPCKPLRQLVLPLVRRELLNPAVNHSREAQNPQILAHARRSLYSRADGLSGQDRHRSRSQVRKPCVRGTRITVGDVLSYLASGMSQQEILADFPQLSGDDIRACLAFAAERERRVVSIPAS